MGCCGNWGEEVIEHQIRIRSRFQHWAGLHSPFPTSYSLRHSEVVGTVVHGFCSPADTQAPQSEVRTLGLSGPPSPSPGPGNSAAQRWATASSFQPDDPGLRHLQLDLEKSKATSLFPDKESLTFTAQSPALLLKEGKEKRALLHSWRAHCQENKT